MKTSVALILTTLAFFPTELLAGEFSDALACSRALSAGGLENGFGLTRGQTVDRVISNESQKVFTAADPDGGKGSYYVFTDSMAYHVKTPGQSAEIASYLKTKGWDGSTEEYQLSLPEGPVLHLSYTGESTHIAYKPDRTPHEDYLFMEDDDPSLHLPRKSSDDLPIDSRLTDRSRMILYTDLAEMIKGLKSAEDSISENALENLRFHYNYNRKADISKLAQELPSHMRPTYIRNVSLQALDACSKVPQLQLIVEQVRPSFPKGRSYYIDGPKTPERGWTQPSGSTAGTGGASPAP
jgi:hypothetical protein